MTGEKTKKIRQSDKALAQYSKGKASGSLFFEVGKFRLDIIADRA